MRKQPNLNPILELLLNGEEQAGLDFYFSLNTPSAEDDRWAGFCLLNQQRSVTAKELLIQAKKRGCKEATIELAIAYRFMGEQKQSREMLRELVESQLNQVDQIFFLREHGLQAHLRGNQEEAISSLEKAWGISILNDTTKRLQGGLANVLGMIHNSLQQYQQAIHYFSLCLTTTPIGRRSRLLTYRGLCRINLGHLDAAAQDLAQAKIGLSETPTLAATLEYVLGTLARAKSDWVTAKAALQKSDELARQALDSDTAFYAELSLVAVCTTIGELEYGHLHLARAKRHLQSINARDNAYFALRSGALLAREGDPEGFDLLEHAQAEFARLQASREELWALLHRIEAHLRFGQLEFVPNLLKFAARMAFAVDSKSTIIEMTGLPLLCNHIRSLEPGHTAHVIAFDNAVLPVTDTVELLTIGRAELRINGQCIRLDMTRTIEIMAYLLIHPHSQRDQILSALFPDTDPKRATDYFHQAKKYLNDNAKIIRIEYSAGRKSYALHCQSESFVWDVRQLQQLLSTDTDDRVVVALEQFGGKFLPEATSEWAEGERANLSWSIAKVGLQTLRKWSLAGEHQKCVHLAERLLEIDLDVGLAEYLVNATLAMDGELAAKRALVRIQHRFLSEFDEIPAELIVLEQSIPVLN